MKTRNGFVSNSSSSSFVILTTKDNVNEALDKLPKRIKKFMKNYFICSPKKIKVDRKDYLLYMGTYYTDDWYSELGTGACNCGKEYGEGCDCVSEENMRELFDIFSNNVKPICIIEDY